MTTRVVGGYPQVESAVKAGGIAADKGTTERRTKGSHLRRAATIALACWLVVVLNLSAPAQGADELRPGDVVADGGLKVVVPPRGMRIYAEKWLVRGGYQQLKVTTRWDGTVRVRSRGDEREPATGGDDSSGSGCDDEANRLLGHGWTATFAWSFRADSTPEEMSVADVESSLSNAARNVVREHSPCTDKDEVEAQHTYLGRTLAPADIRFGSLCDSAAHRDGLNSVDFGALPSNVLGMSCTWTSLRSAGLRAAGLESDIRLNRVDTPWFTGAPPDDCTDAYSIEAVMTHEFGHSFGLGHVTEDGHGAQTMSTHINGPCQRSETTLGRGDALGLRALY